MGEPGDRLQNDLPHFGWETVSSSARVKQKSHSSRSAGPIPAMKCRRPAWDGRVSAHRSAVPRASRSDIRRTSPRCRSGPAGGPRGSAQPRAGCPSVVEALRQSTHGGIATDRLVKRRRLRFRHGHNPRRDWYSARPGRAMARHSFTCGFSARQACSLGGGVENVSPIAQASFPD